MPKNKVEEVSTVNNTFFGKLENKSKVTIAGIVKSIEEKATPYGSAKRFKGDLIVQSGDDTYRAKNLFVPDSIRDSIIAGANKLGKWSSFEFVLNIEKTFKEDHNGNQEGPTAWNGTFKVNPRIQLDRVLALIEA